VTDAPHNTVVATFRRPADARDAALDLERRVPSRSAVETFGQTVLLALATEDDAGRRQWLATFQGKAADVFVATPQAPARTQFSCLASSADAAASIEQEAGDYFLGPAMHLIPPWADPDARTPAERAAHTHARRTYARLLRSTGEVHADPRMQGLSRKMLETVRSGDAAESQRLRGEQERLVAELKRSRIARLRAEQDADIAVVDRYQALIGGSAQQPDSKRMSAEIGPSLGQLELIDGVPDPKRSASGAMGFLGRQGLLVNMPFLRFGSTFEGPAAMVRWLQSKGCTDFRYQFSVGSEIGLDAEEEE
jgi:hypothetical protein